MEPIKDAAERVGGNATFKCKVPYEGAPVEWFHNGKRIYPEKDPSKFEVVSDGLFKTLIIKNLQENEQGKLGVKIGESMCQANLQISGTQQIQPSILI